MNTKPKVITEFPGQAVEFYYRKYGMLPTMENMKTQPMPLMDRLELAAQACRAAHLLSCERTIREAMAELQKRRDDIQELLP